MGRPHTSYTALTLFLHCNYAYYLKYIRKVPSLYTGEMVLGTAVHAFIARMERPLKKQDRRFFYKTLDSAIKAWFVYWRNFYRDRRAMLVDYTDDQYKRLLGFGSACIKKYWELHADSYGNSLKPRPISVEESIVLFINGMNFPAKPDQLRNVSMEYILKERPDLVVAGQIVSGYNPVVILDIKTTSETWFYVDDETGVAVRIKPEKDVLKANLQVISYTQAYKRKYGNFPIGFVFLTLPTSSFIFTHAEGPRSVLILENAINALRHGLNEESFPYNTGKHCAECLFKGHCDVFNKDTTVTFEMLDASMPGLEKSDELLSKLGEIKKPRQLRFNFNKSGEKGDSNTST